jgi:cohesin complex subunit SCC1
MPSRDALLLPDVLTEGDNLEMPPLPDASFLFSQMEDDLSQLTPRARRAGSRDINLANEFGASQYLQNSIAEPHKYPEEELALDPDDLDLDLDFGEDIVERSVEMGRDAPVARPLGEDIGDSELNIFTKDGTILGDRQQSIQVSIAGDDEAFHFGDDDGDIHMEGADDLTLRDELDAPLGITGALDRARISESPLSDIDPQMEHELEEEHTRNMESGLFEPADETEHSVHRQPAQRARKLKLLKPDEDTILSSAVIKAQQQDRSKILRPESFLPRDPALFALVEMQRSGGFVSNVLGDGRSATWAPELRGMLSLEAIMKSRDLKRKRDSGIADMSGDEDAHALKSPRLELEIGEEGDVDHFNADAGFETAPAEDGTMMEIPADDGFQPIIEDEENYGQPASRPASRDGSMPMSPMENNFDETTAPLVHPADNGPVSLGTKHAVHLLRERFGPEAENSPDKRKKSSVLFQDLLPEARTSKADATKMFFEILVLATKDAVKVEQPHGSLGGPIRVRGKRGLWGSWAETEAGGEIAEEDEAAAGASAPVAVEA